MMIQTKVALGEALQIASATSDAYSYSRYTPSGWRESCRELARRGLDAKQIEEIMRSKWMRWAGDMSDNCHGGCTSADLMRFLDSEGKITPENVNEKLGI